MRNTPNYGMAAALAIIAMRIERQRKAENRVAVTRPPKELTEREKWNAEVDAKKAAKKARKASSGSAA
jgi:hypothetical protein